MRPSIAVTPGEPAGVGPELLARIAQQPLPCALVAIANPDVLSRAASYCGIPLELVGFDAGPHQPGTLQVIPVEIEQLPKPGQLQTNTAAYILECLDQAVDGCMNNQFQAMVTGPIQKSIINDAGIAFSGHTEYLAERSGRHHPVMMLANSRLRVALYTTHLPLRAVPDALNPADLERVIRILHRDLQNRFQFDNPRIAVCGLNPHAGESGHLGREEIDIMQPVLQRLNTEGMRLTGPLPADTAFTRESLAQCDAVLAMYHDQGLPVIKHAGFGEVVNITLGLPIIRTSVDHGTALDLAGSGRAKPDSLRCAIELAITMSGSCS